MLVIKYGYMFRLILSHPQANMVTCHLLQYFTILILRNTL